MDQEEDEEEEERDSDDYSDDEEMDSGIEDDASETSDSEEESSAEEEQPSGKRKVNSRFGMVEDLSRPKVCGKIIKVVRIVPMIKYADHSYCWVDRKWAAPSTLPKGKKVEDLDEEEFIVFDNIGFGRDYYRKDTKEMDLYKFEDKISNSLALADVITNVLMKKIAQRNKKFGTPSRYIDLTKKKF